MSKNQKSEKGLGVLQAILTPSLEPMVVAAIVNDLQLLPEFAVIETVQGILYEATEIQLLEQEAMDKAAEGALKMPGLNARISELNLRIAKLKSDVVEAVLNSGAITAIRASILGVQRLSAHLDRIAEDRLVESASFTDMREELRNLVLTANKTQAETESASKRVKELRQSRIELEMEARAILSSVNL